MRQSIAGIIHRDGKFLIGKRLPGGEMGERWEFPGGKVDEGETPVEAIIREFREEMDVTVSVAEHIATVEFSNKNGRSSLLAFHLILPDDPEITLAEHSAVRWATLEEIEGLSFVDSDRLLFPAIREWCNHEKE
jgi:8-oxo-dGTP diphosphatase